MPPTKSYQILITGVISSIIIVLILFIIRLLVKCPSNHVAVLEHPLALTTGLAVLKRPLVVLAIWENPSAM